MPVEFESNNDKEKWNRARKNIGEILNLEPEKVLNYFVLVYDGTGKLKADTDIPEVDVVTATLVVFLEHLTGKLVSLEDKLPPGGFINDTGEVDNR